MAQFQVFAVEESAGKLAENAPLPQVGGDSVSHLKRTVFLLASTRYQHTFRRWHLPSG